ncbi:hypothetical protein SAMN06265360_108168 [Haloechinothrix alba]|uniref:Uncharacterized protein n=1 Tax=Haloechinothrix alba TaxID=664784 RepID=A0A238X0K2_9PSEU|nr:hypothetical protein [Haloechinothrix alba]SNR52485.1 hypothetical protein SAMN06265360_108168 [Haloechinothrix alba]
MTDFNSVWRRSTVAELSWLGPRGPVGLPVVPLELDGVPCAALPYLHLDTVDSLVTEYVAASVTDTRTLGEDATAAVAAGRVSVRHDLDGTIFTDKLLEQEIVKHPPTRLRAAGLLARRENWWWVPRVLITVVEIDSAAPVPVRSGPADGLLVRRDGTRPCVEVVTAREWPARSGERIDVWPRDGGLLEGDGSRVYVYGHRHSPDFERWEPWYRGGVLSGETFTVSDGNGEPGLELEPFGIVGRIRNHRAVERSCRAGIDAVERRSGSLR